MKKIFIFFSVLAAGLISCEGDQGPQGPPGYDGVDAEMPAIFEVENVNYDYEADNNLWSTLLTYSDFTDFEVFENDVVLVYRLDSTVELNDGSTADAWSLMPQNFFLDKGTIQYVYNHTFLDTELFIDGDHNLADLDPGFTDNQVIRVAIIPALMAKDFNGDYSNFSDVMGALKLSEADVMKVQM